MASEGKKVIVYSCKTADPKQKLDKLAAFHSLTMEIESIGIQHNLFNSKYRFWLYLTGETEMIEQFELVLAGTSIS